MPLSKWRRREYGHRGLLYARRLLAQTGGRQPDRLCPVPVATRPLQPRAGNRRDRARRGGQVGPNPAGLHPSPEAASTPSTQGSDDHLSGGEVLNCCLRNRVASHSSSMCQLGLLSLLGQRPHPLNSGPTSGMTAGNGCETAHVKTPDRGQPSGQIGRLQLAETEPRGGRDIPHLGGEGGR